MVSVAEIIDSMVVTRTSDIWSNTEIYCMYSTLAPDYKTIVELEDSFLCRLPLFEADRYLKRALADIMNYYARHLSKKLNSEVTRM